MMAVATKYLPGKYKLRKHGHTDRWEGQCTANAGELRTVVNIHDFLAQHTLRKVCKEMTYFIH